jgi:hypothetical protein
MDRGAAVNTHNPPAQPPQASSTGAVVNMCNPRGQRPSAHPTRADIRSWRVTPENFARSAPTGALEVERHQSSGVTRSGPRRGRGEESHDGLPDKFG